MYRWISLVAKGTVNVNDLLAQLLSIIFARIDDFLLMETPCQLQIRHSADNGENKFQVIRIADGTNSVPVVLTPPDEIIIHGGHGKKNLLGEWKWYLEEYLQYPFGEYHERANRVFTALQDWGSDCFNKLFSDHEAILWYDKARNSDQGLEDLRIKIASNVPAILAWPWEGAAINCCCVIF